MGQDYRTAWEKLRLLNGQYADLFVERSVPKGSEDFDNYAVLSFVPRVNAPRVDLHLETDQLRRLVTFLDDYCRELEGFRKAPSADCTA